MNLRSRIGVLAFIKGKGAWITNILLISLSLALVFRSIGIWTGREHLPPPEKRRLKAQVNEDGAAFRPAPSKVTYDVIVEEDIFRPERHKYVAPPKARPVAPPPPPPPPRKPPPRLTLIGTVLLDDHEAAIMEVAGSGVKSTYSVGSAIEDFIIKDIKRDAVILERDGEVLRIGTGEFQQTLVSKESVRAYAGPPETGAAVNVKKTRALK